MTSGDFLFDKRIIERNIWTGLVSQEEYQTYLKKLKDASLEAAALDVVLQPIKKDIPTRVMENEEEEF